MTRFKRRLLIGLALVLLAVAGLGGWLFVFVFVGPDAAIRRAEYFSFRRMTVVQLDEQGGYRFFFASNRHQEAEAGPIEERFGAQRQERLTFGSFDTRIEPSLGLGMIINPTEWLQNDVIRLRDVSILDRMAFVGQLRKLVQESPHRSLLIIVHGFRERFPSALRRTAFVGHILDINAPTLLFDWPGNQGSTPAGYRRASRMAAASGAELAQTLELIIRDVRPERLWLIANSMGAEVVTHAFSRLYEQPDLADAQTEIENVVLTAPDVSRDQFKQQFKTQIKALARHLTVYVSSNDRALLMSRILNWDRRLGESTLSPDQLDEAVSLAELVDPDSDRITLVDVTPVNRTRNFHNFSLETPEFFDDLFLRLTNESPPRSRLLYDVKTQDGRVYWVLTRAR